MVQKLPIFKFGCKKKTIFTLFFAFSFWKITPIRLETCPQNLSYKDNKLKMPHYNAPFYIGINHENI